MGKERKTNRKGRNIQPDTNRRQSNELLNTTRTQLWSLSSICKSDTSVAVDRCQAEASRRLLPLAVVPLLVAWHEFVDEHADELVDWHADKLAAELVDKLEDKLAADSLVELDCQCRYKHLRFARYPSLLGIKNTFGLCNHLKVNDNQYRLSTTVEWGKIDACE